MADAQPLVSGAAKAVEAAKPAVNAVADAATHAAHTAAAHHEGGLDPKIVYLIAFVVFVLLVGKKAVSAFKAQLISYRDTATQELDEARRLREDAEKLQREYQQKLDNAEADAAEIVARARAEADSFKAQAFSELQKEMEERKRGAVEKNALFESLIQFEFRQKVVDNTIASLEKILEERNAAGQAAQLNPAVMAVLENIAADADLKKQAA
ncbi:MAG: ATP synthase F0 subunit B [Alphaproteobacteria bacterium]|nr:ATP synthase F0 subunit B [Alphaproteobacteria bacterium]